MLIYETTVRPAGTKVQPLQEGGEECTFQYRDGAFPGSNISIVNRNKYSKEATFISPSSPLDKRTPSTHLMWHFGTTISPILALSNDTQQAWETVGPAAGRNQSLFAPWINGGVCHLVGQLHPHLSQRRDFIVGPMHDD